MEKVLAQAIANAVGTPINFLGRSSGASRPRRLPGAVRTPGRWPRDPAPRTLLRRLGQPAAEQQQTVRHDRRPPPHERPPTQALHPDDRRCGRARPTPPRSRSPPDTPVLVTNLTTPPAGLPADRQAGAGDRPRDPRVAELHRHPHAIAYEYTKGPGQWQVSWFSEDEAPARAAPGLRRRLHRQGHPGVDGLSGGLVDGPRLSGRVRPPRERLVHLDPAVPAVHRARSSRRRPPGCCISTC